MVQAKNYTATPASNRTNLLGGATWASARTAGITEHQTGKIQSVFSGLYYFHARFYDPVVGRFVGRDPVRVLQRGSRIYAISGNNPVALADPTGKCAMCLNNASNSPGSDSNDFASGGTKTQRDLIEAAFQNACSRIDNVWKDRIPGHEVEPRALDQYKKCLKEKCKTPPRFVVGGIFCDWFDIQGYTFSRPYNPFNVCKIHMCPDYLVSASDGVTPSYIIDETVMHEMSHCCDCQNEDWALEIGSWFYMEEEPQSQVP